MRRRRFIQYMGLGSISCAITAQTARGVLASPLTEIVSRNPGNLSLKPFEFKTETLTQKGIAQKPKTYTAKYFSVPVDHRQATESIEMVAINAPRRKTNVSPFFMSKFAITQAQWAAVAALPKVHQELDPTPSHFQGASHPVESVSWLAAVEFCDRLSQHTGKTYRLPTEVEWEYACRAGTQTPFHTGKTITSQYANYVGTYTYKAESPGEYRQSTVPVGSFSPNAFGLYDMHGNVWEWCSDRWQPHTHQASLRARSLRTIRGGSWSDGPMNLLSSSRSGYVATGLNRTIGFRVATS